MLLDASRDEGLWHQYMAWLLCHLQTWALNEMRRTLGEATVEGMPEDERGATLARYLAADGPTLFLTRVCRLTQCFAEGGPPDARSA
jgi:hypothetical protein